MRNIMISYGQTFIFHFTDKRNIEGIKKRGGIFSYTELSKSTSGEIIWGGNDWSHDADKTNGVDDYVHLCFIANHPMEFRAKEEGRIKETVWIKVHRDVLLLKGVRFTNEVSNKSGAKLLTNAQAVKELDHEAIFTRIDFRVGDNHERKARAEKYEILVPKYIPIKYLENI